MALLSNGISNVRALAIPAGVFDDGTTAGNTGTVLVKWRSSYTDKLYQIYVNSRFAGFTFDYQQRQATVPIPASEQTAVKIEVFATEAENAHLDQSSQLSSSTTQQGRIQIDFAKTGNLPMEATVDYYHNNGSGDLDYDNSANPLPILLWPRWQDKSGFGLSSFGKSDFGFDGSASVGFGRGSFGFGKFVFDACLMSWQSGQLTAGNYKFGLKITDRFGNVNNSIETEQLTVIPPAKPAEKLSISVFNKSINQLILKID